MADAGEWARWVGRTTTVTDTLDPAQARKMQATLDREPAIAVGEELPPAWHWLYFHDPVRAGDLGDDGHPRLGLSLPQFPLTRRMWAGGRLEWARPLRVGVPAIRTSTVASIDSKQGRTGSLIFVAINHEVTQGGQTCIVERQDVVYREAAGSAGEVAPMAAEVTCDHEARWTFDSAALFRYSALTFNSHRIHYDADYARDVEGYPGVIVHGPLLATLLLDIVVQNGRTPRSMEYRAKNPVFLPDSVVVRSSREGDAVHVWAARGTGGLAMDGTITVT